MLFTFPHHAPQLCLSNSGQTSTYVSQIHLGNGTGVCSQSCLYVSSCVSEPASQVLSGICSTDLLPNLRSTTGSQSDSRFLNHTKKNNALDWHSQPVHSPRFSFIRNLTQKNPWFIFYQRRPRLCCPVQRSKTLPQWVVIELFTSRELNMASSCNTAIFISSQACVQPALKTT